MWSESRIRYIPMGSCFGNFYPMTGENWTKSFICSEKDTVLLEIDCEKLL